MRVVGIDPGTMVTGWGVIEAVKNGRNGVLGNGTRYLQSGRIIPPRGEDIHKRLSRIYGNVTRILTEWSPDAVSVEKAFMADNPQSALRLGEARGVILLASAEMRIDLYEYSPAEVKTAITGYGRASKEEVQRMVCRLLGHNGPLPEDEADALGAALSCLHRYRFTRTVTESEQREK